jgi:hypothetical protein
MRRWLCAIVLATIAAPAAFADDVQLALDGAADLSPVYPTVTIPANAHDFVAIFTYGDHQNHHVSTNFVPIDAAGPFRITPEAHAEAVAFGDKTRFLMRQPFLTDIPVGRWKMIAKVEDKEVGGVEFTVVPAAPPKPAAALELAGSLATGSEWNYLFRFLAQPLPGLRLSFDNITDIDAEGWIDMPLVHRIVSQDPAGAHREEVRGKNPPAATWLIATDRGLALTQVDDGTMQALDPPQLVALIPDETFHRTWQWSPKKREAKIAQKFQMWGPLPVKTPQGELPGYVVLRKVPDPNNPETIALSIEYEFVPGLGQVRQTVVQMIPGANAAARIEIDLKTMTRGSGPAPELRKYPDSP